MSNEIEIYFFPCAAASASAAFLSSAGRGELVGVDR